MEKITITIQAGGKYAVETSGFKGKSCEQATDELLTKLGGEKKTEHKPEYAMLGKDPKTGHYQM